MEVLLEKHLHQIPADEVITLFDSDAVKGLDLFEIQARQRRFGPNAIPVQRGHGPLIRFLLHFHQPLVYILLAAGTITAVLNEWIDAGVIFAVVLVNATIGFLQESEAAKALDALSKMTVTDARVLRSGEVHKIPSVELVPGDIVVLQSRRQSSGRSAALSLPRPADGRIDSDWRVGSSAEKR